MSDRAFLERHRITSPDWPFPDNDFDGAFAFPVEGEARRVCCIAGYADGWKHVSVSFGGKYARRPDATPSWRVMCRVRELFFEPDEWVIQFHPPVRDNVNMHESCLHLWAWTGGKFPVPPKEFV